MKSLFIHGRSPGMLMTGRSQALASIFPQRYSTDDQESILHEVGEKARSTAEEFVRQAQEKTDSAKQTAKDILQDAQEAVVGETREDNEKRFKEKVEKGNYNKIGRD